jgi:uncharacterized glyoxalase superfamily protein PhnB
MDTKKKAHYLPKDHNVVSPYLTVSDANAVLTFAKEVFGAEIMIAHKRPDGTVGHAELRIGDTVVMVGQSDGSSKKRETMLHVYVEDVDATYARALQSGGTAVSPPADQPYGDRGGGVEDPQGTTWWIATHIEDLTDAEMSQRLDEMYAKRKRGE